MSKKRIYFIDVVKGIAMLSIVVGHISYLPNPFDEWLSMFKITLFFYISGYMTVLLGQNKEGLQTPKLFRLLKEYLIWSCIAIIVDLFFSVLKGSYDLAKIQTSIIHVITLRGVSTLWFLPPFYIAQTVFNNVLAKRKKVVVLASFILTLISLTVLIDLYNGIEGISLLISDYLHVLIKSCLAFVFMICGFAVASGCKTITKNTRLNCVISVVLFVLGTVFARFCSGVDINNINFGNHVLIYCALSVSICIAITELVAELCKYVKLPILDWIGVNSLFVMKTHLPLQLTTISRNIFKKILYETEFSFLYFIELVGITTLVFAIELALYLFINKKEELLRKYGK